MGAPCPGNGFAHYLLSSVKRFGDFKANENLSTKIIQHSSELFDLTFLERGIPTVGFSLNGKDKRDKKYISMIKDYPLIFYDLEGIVDYFGDIIIKKCHEEFELSEIFEK